MIDNSTIEKITILVGKGNDVVIIDTKLPCPYNDKTIGNLKLKFECGNCEGISYVQNNFMPYTVRNYDVVVINTKSGKTHILD